MIHCDCSADDFDKPTVCTAKFVRARVEHECGECGRTIAVGESYEYVRGLWCGHWETHKTCPGCVNIRDDFCPSGWIYGSLAEQLEACLGFNYARDLDDDDEDECEEPCQYPGCEICQDYWRRMVAERRWEPGKGWTDKGLKSLK